MPTTKSIAIKFTFSLNRVRERAVCLKRSILLILNPLRRSWSTLLPILRVQQKILLNTVKSFLYLLGKFLNTRWRGQRHLWKNTTRVFFFFLRKLYPQSYQSFKNHFQQAFNWKINNVVLLVQIIWVWCMSFSMLIWQKKLIKFFYYKQNFHCNSHIYTIINIFS